MAGWFLIFFTSSLLVIFVLRNDPTLKGFGLPKTSQILGVHTIIDVVDVDERVPLLWGYLQAKDSPLASKAAEMVATADRYQFDWRLLPAIAGKESSFGKKIPWDKEAQKPSYNAWGWGIYGDQVLSFSSWEEGIEKVGAGLRDGYLNKNLVTIEDIMRYFTPRSDGSWARDVSFIMEQIEK